jgi:hypothetical protein
VKAATGLSANLVVRAIGRVSAAIKVAAKKKKTVKEFNIGITKKII